MGNTLCTLVCMGLFLKITIRMLKNMNHNEQVNSHKKKSSQNTIKTFYGIKLSSFFFYRIAFS